MPHAGYTTAEVARRGREIYERNIRAKVEAEHHGKFLAVDITTGQYEIADDDLTASDRAPRKNPQAILFGLRIGYPFAYRLGGRSLVKQP